GPSWFLVDARGPPRRHADPVRHASGLFFASIGGPMSNFFDPASNPAFFSAEHEQFRASLRAFVAREIAPNVDAWDEAGRVPRELYGKAAALGILGVGFPEEYGGTPADEFMKIVVAEEIARAGS